RGPLRGSRGRAGLRGLPPLALALRAVGADAGVRLGLGARCEHPGGRLEALPPRPVGLDPLWLDLGLGRTLWLGDLPLRPVGLPRRAGLVLGTRLRLGPRVGGLAAGARRHRLGAPLSRPRVGGRRLPRPRGPLGFRAPRPLPRASDPPPLGPSPPPFPPHPLGAELAKPGAGLRRAAAVVGGATRGAGARGADRPRRAPRALAGAGG